MSMLHRYSFVVEGSYNYAPKYGKFGYVAAKVAAGSCPYGWSLYHGSCYYFSRDRLTWWQASVIIRFYILRRS